MKKKERGYNKPNGNIKGCIQERLLTPMTHYDKCLIINQEKNYSESGIINRKSGELVHEITKNIKSENPEKDISFYSCRKRKENV